MVYTALEAIASQNIDKLCITDHEQSEVNPPSDKDLGAGIYKQAGYNDSKSSGSLSLTLLNQFDGFSSGSSSGFVSMNPELVNLTNFVQCFTVLLDWQSSRIDAPDASPSPLCLTQSSLSHSS